MATTETTRPISPTPSQLPPVPSSPVYSVASTANRLSTFNLPLPPPPRPVHAVLSKVDLGNSQQAYAELLSSAKTYRLALATLSTAASTFGSALELCARLKEARAEPIGIPSAANMIASFTTKGSCTADMLMSASGVHHLVANHQQILSETVYRSFEVPLLHDLDKWQSVVDDEEETYKRKVKEQSREIKRLEKEGMKLYKQRRRDVGRFRAHLVDLTHKVDGLTVLHADHARVLLRESQETSSRIVDASCSLVRAEVDIFESLARKGWSGGGLDELLEKGQDLFANEDESLMAASAGGSAETAKLFSILPPKSILADSASEMSKSGHIRSDSLGADTERYQSLAAIAAESKPSGDGDSVFSSDFNKPRNARPFSPQPIRRIPMDVTFESLGTKEEQPGVDEPEYEHERSDFRNGEFVHVEPRDGEPEPGVEVSNHEQPGDEQPQEEDFRDESFRIESFRDELDRDEGPEDEQPKNEEPSDDIEPSNGQPEHNQSRKSGSPSSTEELSRLQLLLPLLQDESPQEYKRVFDQLSDQGQKYVCESTVVSDDATVKADAKEVGEAEEAYETTKSIEALEDLNKMDDAYEHSRGRDPSGRTSPELVTDESSPAYTWSSGMSNNDEGRS